MAVGEARLELRVPQNNMELFGSLEDLQCVPVLVCRRRCYREWRFLFFNGSLSSSTLSFSWRVMIMCLSDGKFEVELTNDGMFGFEPAIIYSFKRIKINYLTKINVLPSCPECSFFCLFVETRECSMKSLLIFSFLAHVCTDDVG